MANFWKHISIEETMTVLLALRLGCELEYKGDVYQWSFKNKVSECGFPSARKAAEHAIAWLNANEKRRVSTLCREVYVVAKYDGSEPFVLIRKSDISFIEKWYAKIGKRTLVRKANAIVCGSEAFLCERKLSVLDVNSLREKANEDDQLNLFV
jgi:hypothetical protein